MVSVGDVFVGGVFPIHSRGISSTDGRYLLGEPPLHLRFTSVSIVRSDTLSYAEVVIACWVN